MESGSPEWSIRYQYNKILQVETFHTWRGQCRRSSCQGEDCRISLWLCPAGCFCSCRLSSRKCCCSLTQSSSCLTAAEWMCNWRTLASFGRVVSNVEFRLSLKHRMLALTSRSRMERAVPTPASNIQLPERTRPKTKLASNSAQFDPHA
jgi:hypothetical protein